MIDNALGTFKPERIAAIKQKLHDELIVYDPAAHRSHCLNKSASQIWLACDGKSTVSEIVEQFAHETESGFNEAIIVFGLRKLDEAGLLASAGSVCQRIQPRTRREMLRRLGYVAAVALPVVASLLVPPPARAASCFPLLHSCTASAQCCSGVCGLSGVNLVCLP